MFWEFATELHECSAFQIGMIHGNRLQKLDLLSICRTVARQSNTAKMHFSGAHPGVNHDSGPSPASL
jgi:hypothetical protein